jgi:peptidoglycan/LPS O-acetylase OafA/YrhL
LKIFPSYWVAWTLTLILGIILLWSGHTGGPLDAYRSYESLLTVKTWLILGWSNLFILGQDVLFFTQLNTHTGNLFFSDRVWQTNPHVFDFMLSSQAWSVSCELLFYLVAPHTVRKPLVTVVVIAGSLGLRYFFMIQGNAADPWSYRFFPFELQFFYMGVAAWYIYKRFNKTTFLNNKYLAYLALAIILIFTLIYADLPDDLYLLSKRFLVFNNGFFIFPFKFWVYISVLFIGIPLIFNCTKLNKKDRWIGELSYPVYICHILVIFLFDAFQWKDTTDPYRTVSICGVTLVVAIVMNNLIVQPIEHYRQRRLKQKMVWGTEAIPATVPAGL